MKEPAWSRAEKQVAELLQQLPSEEYLVLNDVEARYGNIDHLVIRRDGAVFLIETKSHVGKVTFDGQELRLDGKPFRRNPICQIQRNIRWLRVVLKTILPVKPWVVAVLVFPNAEVAVKRSVRRVNVMTADRLIEFIRAYPSQAKTRHRTPRHA